MKLNQTPSAERIHIGIFGKRNAGKSSLINALAGQPVSIVSDFKGTTTDPVKKAMELLPLGPVVLTDTPGLDDTGELGTLRIEKTQQILNTTDIALLVIDGQLGITEEDTRILQQIRQKQIPFVIAVNKMDLTIASPVLPDEISREQILYVSAAAGTHIHELKELLAKQLGQTPKTRKIVGDLIHPGDFVVLVIPIDKAAPKGRLILPQQQTIRDILDHGATAIAVRDSELSETLKNLGRSPALVITDSQVFDTVAKIVPREVPLTSFFDFICQIQRKFRTCRPWCTDPENIKRRGSCTDLRRLHPSSAVRRHRNCQTAQDAKTVYTERFAVYIYKRNGFSVRSVSLSGNHPLRRMHADRKRNAVSIRLRQRTGHSNYELWNCHCVYARDFREKYGVILKNRGNLPLNKLKVSFV